MKNILDFGAVGDGKTVNTTAIQAAIDSGGAVYIPEGVFVTGTLHLKSGGGLFLAHGAVLKASHRREDYNAADYCPQNAVFHAEFMNGTHLISAVEQEDIFLAGFGCIDGDSHFWVNESRKEWYCGFFAHPPREAERPGQMIFFAECRNVRVQDVRLQYAPFWHLFLHGCEDVQVRGISVRGERRQWVNDGIDIDCCKRVTVSDCIIDTGDDAITLRASEKRLLHSDGICEDVVITNCILTSYLDYGIRIGVGGGLIRNCMLSNLVIRDSLCGVGITCRFLGTSSGISVENIRFQNLTVNALTAIGLRMSNSEDHPPFPEFAYMKDISFDGVTARCCRESYVLGYENTAVSDISFRNMTMYFEKESPDHDRAPCNWNDVRDKNTAFYLRDAGNVLFDQVRLVLAEDVPWQHSLFHENCENLRQREIL